MVCCVVKASQNENGQSAEVIEVAVVVIIVLLREEEVEEQLVRFDAIVVWFWWERVW
jgi:hypothetical protein